MEAGGQIVKRCLFNPAKLFQLVRRRRRLFRGPDNARHLTGPEGGGDERAGWNGLPVPGVIEWFVELLFTSDGIIMIMRYNIQYFRIYPISEFNADHQDKESGHLQVCGNRGTQTTEIELHCKTEKAVSL